MMRRLPILILTGIVGIAGLTIVTFRTGRTIDLDDRTLVTDDRTAKDIIQAVLEVQDLSYKVFVPEGSTAFDLMSTAKAKYDNFSFDGKEFTGLGFFVEEVNGLKQDKDKAMYLSLIHI